jgi:tetratricopeptide (TPR) repeat protein
MSSSVDDESGWHSVTASLRGLDLDDTPSLEFWLLEILARWLVSDRTPSDSGVLNDAAVATSALFSAVESASSSETTSRPNATNEIAFARGRLVEGAKEFADAADGLSVLIARLMPTAEGVLSDNAGDPGAQLYWLYCYFLLAVASGVRGDVDQAVLRGLMASFSAWDELLAKGPVGILPRGAPVVARDGSASGVVMIQGGQGVQIGDFGRQENTFIAQYVEAQVVHVQQAPVSWPVLFGDIPQQPPAWQPRSDLLAALGFAGPGAPVVRALIGMRGTGKTQLAAAYARSRMAASWRLVAWVDAGDTASMLYELGNVASRIGVREPADDLSSSASAVRHFLEASGEKCLLVFDDATDLKGLRPFLPATGNAQVIVTSTRQAAADLGLLLSVESYTEEEALAFLAARTRNADAAGARVLADELGRLPLALAQAAAVIARQRLTYATYLDRLRMMPVHEYLHIVEADPYPRGVAAALLLSVDSAGARDADSLPGAVLDVIALLSPGGVSRSLLYAAGNGGVLKQAVDPAEVPTAVDEVLARLADASLLTFNSDGSSVNTHSLVMRVVREMRARDGSLAATATAVTQILLAVSDSIVPEWRNPGAVEDLARHAMAIYEHLLPWLTSRSRLTDADSELLVNLLVLRDRAVSQHVKLGVDPVRDVDYIEPVLADYERFLGEEHPSTLRLRSDLAAAYQATGRIAEAIALGERTLADQERILGTEDPATLTSRNNLALAYQLAGRDDDAIFLHERVLDDRQRLAGEDHPDTLLAQNNLADAYQFAGRIAEAVPLFERTLASRQRVLGKDHPDTLVSQGNLASAYHADDRLSQAIALYERTLAAQEASHRADHPDALGLRYSLGEAYMDTGKTGQALRLLGQLLADCERVLGPDHPHTQMVREALARARQKLSGSIADKLPPQAVHAMTVRTSSTEAVGASPTRPPLFRLTPRHVRAPDEVGKGPKD